MRIGFVGKGGSGKTTTTALFVDYIKKVSKNKIAIFDADINIHLAELLSFSGINSIPHLSDDDSTADIKKYIKGSNDLILELSHIKKTTPPSDNSGFIDLNNPDNIIYDKYSLSNDDQTYLSIVGSYNSDGIGKSCYHNNLSILENILTHSIDNDAYAVVDMVAGVDAFAGSLHAQFDVLVLVVEPTQRSISVYNQYYELAVEAGVDDYLFVVANKIEDEDDNHFILETIPKDKYLGSISKCEHLKRVDKGREVLNSSLMDENSKSTLNNIDTKLNEIKRSYNDRLEMLIKLHKIYSSQGYIIDRCGDLTLQIDPDFDFDLFVKNYHA